MPVQITPKADFLVVEFGQDLSIFAVNDLYQQLRKVPELSGERIIVDLTEVTDLDSAGVQLLLWLKQAAADKEISWTCGDNPTVRRVAQLYNLNFLPD